MTPYVSIRGILVYSYGKHEAVIVLKAYTDESGHSGDSPFVCIGGCIGAASTWTHFERDWINVLEEGRLSLGLKEPLVFHMTEFEASEGQFRGWKENLVEHRSFLAKLLSIMKRHEISYIAASEPVYKLPNGKLAYSDDPYYSCLIGILDGAAMHLGMLKEEEKLQIVFADHPEYGKRVRQIFPQVKAVGGMYSRLASDEYGSPKDIIPLQAADLVAFEIRKEWERIHRRPYDRTRWPYTQLQEKLILWNGYPIRP
jgi:hypothetical protein